MRDYDSRMPALPEVAVDADAIASALSAHGACRIVGLPQPDAVVALRDDLRRLQGNGMMHPAAVGRGPGHALRHDIRGDAALWLDDAHCGNAARAYLDTLETLRSQLDRRLFLGLAEVEAHYAAYPPDAGYARHRDRFHDSDARVLSLVSYLNENWGERDGGALRLYLGRGVLGDGVLDGDALDGAIEIAPVGGTSVCFLSELEHEVLPARRERLSIAAWMRRRAAV